MTEAQRKSITWVPSDRKILSATNHDVQGIGKNLMTKLMVSFVDEKSGWINIYTTLYLCTVIPFALLLGRPLMEDPATGRAGDSANGVQRFDNRCSRFVTPPAPRPLGKSEMIPVFALLDTMIPPGVPTIIPCTTGTVMGRRVSINKPRNAEIGSDVADELPSRLCGWPVQGDHDAERWHIACFVCRWSSSSVCSSLGE